MPTHFSTEEYNRVYQERREFELALQTLWIYIMGKKTPMPEPVEATRRILEKIDRCL